MWNPTFLAHLLTVAAIVLAGQLALGLRPGQLLRLSREGLRSTLWVLASLTLSVLLWREPPGLWPAGLLIAQLLVLGFLSRLAPSPAFAVAVPLAAFTVLVRTLGADDTMARASAEQLVNVYTLMRVLACVALAVAGDCLAGSGAARYADPVGRTLSGAAGVVLLFVLSQAWTRYLERRHQGHARAGPVRAGERAPLADAGGAFGALDRLRRRDARVGLRPALDGAPLRGPRASSG